MSDRFPDGRFAGERTRPPAHRDRRPRTSLASRVRAGALPACLALAVAGAVPTRIAHAADEPDRGEALYANHCGECHDVTVHRRETSRVRSREELYGWVAGWSVHAGTSWSEEEIESVTSYLSREAYRFTR